MTFTGEHLQVEDATLDQLPDPVPEIYFGGSSPAAGTVAARHADVYLTWGEPPAAVREKIDWIRELAAEARDARSASASGCTRSPGTPPRRPGPRPTGCSPASTRGAIEKVQAGLRRSESEGQRRMLELNQGSKDGLEIYPNVWAGVGLVRGGAGTALVGSHEQVADRIEEYADLGIDEFILSGYPHLENAYWFGEGVLPILAGRGRWEHPAPPRHTSQAVPFAARTAGAGA